MAMAQTCCARACAHAAAGISSKVARIARSGTCGLATTGSPVRFSAFRIVRGSSARKWQACCKRRRIALRRAVPALLKHRASLKHVSARHAHLCSSVLTHRAWHVSRCQCHSSSAHVSAGADTRRRLANRLPKNRELCTKARLAYHLQRHMAELGEQLPAIPQTFTVTAKLQIGNEQQRLQEAAAVAAAAGKGDVWIVKPTSLNRGMGIAVVRGIGACDQACVCLLRSVTCASLVHNTAYTMSRGQKS